MRRTRHRSLVNGGILSGRIPLISLVQFIAVAEHLNFRHAAKALGVSQSSVSARVKTLEENLGVLLFERHARGVRLTDAGRHFMERVAAGVDQLDHAVKTAGMAASGEWGRLRIGIHALIPGSFLDKLLSQYRGDHSAIHIEITEGTARDAVMQLRADRLDVAFVAGKLELPDCHTRAIWTEPLVAALPDGHRLAGQSAITWADLVDETFLVRYGGTGPQVHDHIVLRHAGRWPAPSILRFDVERGTMLSMVGQGFGITIVGAATALLPTTGIIFLPFADEPEPVAFTAVWSPFNRSAALRNLLNLAGRMSRWGDSPGQLRDGDHSAG
jgi:DNA-binding transcriptional LysR family regulator